MTGIQSLGFLLGSSWASGINLYLTVASLGIAKRMEWIELPGQLEVLSHPLVIGVAVVMYLIEFCADKVPYVDSAWDAVHTFIRPVGAILLGYMAFAGTDVDPAVQMAIALGTGAVAFNSHLTKATARAAINTSPEPVSNSVASVTEDACVLGVLCLVNSHPILASLLVILFIVFSIWFLKKMFHLMKRVLSGRKAKKDESKIDPESQTQGDQ